MELSADGVVNFIDAVAALVGEQLYTDKVARQFGKHSFRATGAVYLALMGIAIEIIQLMGRWSRGVVFHYTSAAPLKTIAEDFLRVAVDRKAAKYATDVRSATSWLEATLRAITDDYQRKHEGHQGMVRRD